MFDRWLPRRLKHILALFFSLTSEEIGIQQRLLQEKSVSKSIKKSFFFRNVAFRENPTVPSASAWPPPWPPQAWLPYESAS